MILNEGSAATITQVNFILGILKKRVDVISDKIISDGIAILETCDSAAAVMMALGGGVSGLEMTCKKLEALKLLQQFKASLEDL